MSTSVWPQPLIVVRDVPASARFYAEILEADSGHGGDEYEQIVNSGELIPARAPPVRTTSVATLDALISKHTSFADNPVRGADRTPP